jgi:hypothetical protein
MCRKNRAGKLAIGRICFVQEALVMHRDHLVQIARDGRLPFPIDTPTPADAL